MRLRLTGRKQNGRHAMHDCPAVEAARKLIAEWERKADALNAAAADVAELDRFAPGIDLKHARSAAYDECASKLDMALSRELAGDSPSLPAKTRTDSSKVPASQRGIERLAHCRTGGLHDWQPDPERRREGYACTECGVTEAEERTVLRRTPMPEAASGPAAGFLADVRSRWEVFGEAESLPWLLAALEAARDLADRWSTGRPGADPVLDACARSLRSAIARELPGEEAGRG
jgi:hypothetical protein